MRRLWALIQFYWGRDRHFARMIYNLTGIIPAELELYRLAFRHSSMAQSEDNVSVDCNERLEYLGDSILGSVIAEYLYKRYPTRSEGYLTEMRSKIVGRNSLNAIGAKMGLEEMLEYNTKWGHLHRSYAGNALEALVGAIYLDQGYRRTQKFIHKRILATHFNLRDLEDQNLNFKSQLLEYLQKHKYPLPVFEVKEEEQRGPHRHFVVECQVMGIVLGSGADIKKKNAEQKAAEEALNSLHLLPPMRTNRVSEELESTFDVIEETMIVNTPDGME
jgi:ribonuclease-3